MVNRQNSLMLRVFKNQKYRAKGPLDCTALEQRFLSFKGATVLSFSQLLY